MTTSAWSDTRKPSPGNHILRDDGRICVAKDYVFIDPLIPRGHVRTSGPLTPSEVTPYIPAPRTQQGAPVPLSELPPTQAGSRLDHPHVQTLCGDKIPPRIVSMNTFWPMVTAEPVTCTECQKGKLR